MRLAENSHWPKNWMFRFFIFLVSCLETLDEKNKDDFKAKTTDLIEHFEAALLCLAGHLGLVLGHDGPGELGGVEHRPHSHVACPG